eukprot:CAMPEP_0172902996 /NCGR_PEP_ID=MMETSP1075-20121228/169548_2 /TAXON_ID=2916 /ORGANISM="Ceratium fusus, Strain PA161109" /LENGTH=46 /DNA_ID= /DNA_START= /DNA_END= /DNA_ORIENTATION=
MKLPLPQAGSSSIDDVPESFSKLFSAFEHLNSSSCKRSTPARVARS